MAELHPYTPVRRSPPCASKPPTSRRLSELIDSAVRGDADVDDVIDEFLARHDVVVPTR